MAGPTGTHLVSRTNFTAVMDTTQSRLGRLRHGLDRLSDCHLLPLNTLEADQLGRQLIALDSVLDSYEKLLLLALDCWGL